MVKYVSKSTDVLSKNVAHLDTVLATLQPQSHSLGVVAVLCVRLQNTTHTDANIDTLHATVAEFVNVCAEEQIKFAPDMSKYYFKESISQTGIYCNRVFLVIPEGYWQPPRPKT